VHQRHVGQASAGGWQPLAGHLGPCCLRLHREKWQPRAAMLHLQPRGRGPLQEGRQRPLEPVSCAVLPHGHALQGQYLGRLGTQLPNYCSCCCCTAQALLCIPAHRCQVVASPLIGVCACHACIRGCWLGRVSIVRIKCGTCTSK